MSDVKTLLFASIGRSGLESNKPEKPSSGFKSMLPSETAKMVASQANVQSPASSLPKLTTSPADLQNLEDSAQLNNGEPPVAENEPLLASDVPDTSEVHANFSTNAPGNPILKNSAPEADAKDFTSALTENLPAESSSQSGIEATGNFAPQESNENATLVSQNKPLEPAQKVKSPLQPAANIAPEDLTAEELTAVSRALFSEQERELPVPANGPGLALPANSNPTGRGSSVVSATPQPLIVKTHVNRPLADIPDSTAPFRSGQPTESSTNQSPTGTGEATDVNSSSAIKLTGATKTPMPAGGLQSSGDPDTVKVSLPSESGRIPVDQPTIPVAGLTQNRESMQGLATNGKTVTEPAAVLPSNRPVTAAPLNVDEILASNLDEIPASGLKGPVAGSSSTPVHSLGTNPAASIAVLAPELANKVSQQQTTPGTREPARKTTGPIPASANPGASMSMQEIPSQQGNLAILYQPEIVTMTSQPALQEVAAGLVQTPEMAGVPEGTPGVSAEPSRTSEDLNTGESFRPERQARSMRFAEAITSQIRNVSATEGHTKVELNPKGLGNINIDVIAENDGGLKVLIRAENPNVLNSLREGQGLLSSALNMNQNTAFEFQQWSQNERSQQAAGHHPETEDEALEFSAPKQENQKNNLIDGRQLDIIT